MISDSVSLLCFEDALFFTQAGARDVKCKEVKGSVVAHLNLAIELFYGL